MRARRRRFARYRHDARRRHDRAVGTEAHFYGEHVIGSWLHPSPIGSFKVWWASELRGRLSIRLKLIYSVERLERLINGPHPFLALIRRRGAA